ncbi:hypothetical protein MMC21_007186 [Puttea exsequens]|nr:hypothetical protein [Puttea exsequens]
MDHLPLPTAPNISHVEVALYDNVSHPYSYDSGPWLDYPERHGFSTGSFYTITTGQDRPYLDEARFASFAQAWLFFGFISEFLGIKLYLDEWTETSHKAQKVVCTKSLLAHLDKWLRDLENAPLDKKETVRTHIDLILDRAHNWFSVITVSHEDYRWNSDILPDELSLSIQILQATLVLARNEAFPSQPLTIPRKGKLHLLHNQFLENGWCASDVALLCQDTTCIGEYYASRLGVLPDIKDHSACTDEVCVACQVDSRTYETRHTREQFSCDHLSINIQPILSALDSSNVPVVSFEEDRDKVKPFFKTLEANAETAYVAFSHVWADGLGNPSTNSLPLCQLRRLQAQVNALYGERTSQTYNVPFWIDTLCVPVGTHLRNYRDSAIMGLVTYYKDADKILVLNAELGNISVNRHPIELAFRLGRTAWFRRLWTLQEGVLGQDVYFQAADGAVSMEDILKENTETHRQSPIFDALIHQLHREACAPMLKLETFKAFPAKERIKYIWEAVQWRTTSIKADETVCLSNMLELNLSPLLAIHRSSPTAIEDRMKEFIMQQRLFPVRSLFESYKSFSGDVANMSMPGFKWAPKSFVFRSSKAGDFEKPRQLGYANQNGLSCCFPGVRLRWQDLLGERPNLSFTIPGDWDYWYQLLWSPSNPALSILHERLSASTPALLLEKDIFEKTSEDKASLSGFAGDTWGNTERRMGEHDFNTFFENCVGVFVTIEGSKDGVLFADYRCPISVTKLQYWSSTKPAWTQLHGLGSINEPNDLNCFDRIHSKQKWCIG